MKVLSIKPAKNKIKKFHLFLHKPSLSTFAGRALLLGTTAAVLFSIYSCTRKLSPDEIISLNRQAKAHSISIDSLNSLCIKDSINYPKHLATSDSALPLLNADTARLAVLENKIAKEKKRSAKPVQEQALHWVNINETNNYNNGNSYSSSTYSDGKNTITTITENGKTTVFKNGKEVLPGQEEKADAQPIDTTPRLAHLFKKALALRIEIDTLRLLSNAGVDCQERINAAKEKIHTHEYALFEIRKTLESGRTPYDSTSYALFTMMACVFGLVIMKGVTAWADSH